jgi:hypothetical protein
MDPASPGCLLPDSVYSINIRPAYQLSVTVRWSPLKSMRCSGARLVKVLGASCVCLIVRMSHIVKHEPGTERDRLLERPS